MTWKCPACQTNIREDGELPDAARAEPPQMHDSEAEEYRGQRSSPPEPCMETGALSTLLMSFAVGTARPGIAGNQAPYCLSLGGCG